MKKEKKQEGAPKRGGFTMLKMLFLIGLVPLLSSAIVMLLVSVFTLRGEVQAQIFEKLARTNEGFNEYVYNWYQEEGEEGFTGENKDYEYVDSYSDNGIEMTVFMGATRALTSIKDSSGNRIEGTDAVDAVISAVLNNGEHFTDSGISINDKKYYVDYLPLYDEDGQIVGMTFTGETDETVTSVINRIVIRLIIIVIVMIAVFCVILYFTARLARKPLIEIANVMEHFAQGYLHDDITLKTAVSENRSMVESLKRMQEKLDFTIDDVKGNAGNLHTEVGEIENLSNDSSESAGQIASAVEDLSKGAVSMAENVESLNRDINDMGDKVHEISQSVDDLNDNAKEMMGVSKTASSSMDEVLVGSQNTAKAVEKITHQIMVTNDSINKINEAIELIIGVANQTKLLSLNASIEAARAGEAGKGFAVVAGSISDLSEESNESATTIRNIAEEILNNSNDSVSLAETIKDIIDNEQESVKLTQERIAELDDAIEKSVNMIGQIELKTTELDGVKENIIGNITDLSAISEENAASNEEVSASVDMIATSVSEIAGKMENMNKMSEDLNGAVAYFK